MRKISYAEGQEFINSGISVKALVSRTLIPINSLNDLENLHHLAEEKVQSFELFYEPVNISIIPDNALEIALDEAITLVHDGEVVYSSQKNDEVKISSIHELLSYFRSCNIHGDKCILYWYVD